MMTDSREQLKQDLLALRDDLTSFLLDNVPADEMWEEAFPNLDAIRSAIDDAIAEL
jgi:hypothetical protein